jgi:hypothetical protein
VANRSSRSSEHQSQAVGIPVPQAARQLAAGRVAVSPALRGLQGGASAMKKWRYIAGERDGFGAVAVTYRG